MSTAEFYFFVALAFGAIGVLLGGLLMAGHRLHASAVGRRRAVYGFAIRGFRRHTARDLLVLGGLLIVTGLIGIAATH